MALQQHLRDACAAAEVAVDLEWRADVEEVGQRAAAEQREEMFVRGLAIAQAGELVDFCAEIPLGPRTNRLVDQLTGCGTSIGANYCEADDSLSKKDFAKNIGICRKEARETKFFLRTIARACPEHKIQARRLWQEANELHLIFSKIRRTTLKNLKDS